MKRRQVAAVENKNGGIINDRVARLERWPEQFEEALIREASMNPIEEREVETDEIGEMDTTEIREAEVRQAVIMKKTTSRKVPGIDEISAELHKTDVDVAVKDLTRLFNRIRHEAKVPEKWKKGVIV